MPTLDWLKKEFNYGYDSGNILSYFPNETRKKEEAAIGGNYRQIFKKGIYPYIKKDSRVLELGPGKGSWSRAILAHIPKGELQTIDFQDVSKWLQPEKYGNRLKCITVEGTPYTALPDNYFDFFWSYGVLCHNNKDNIFEILKNTLPKLKKGAFSVHEYADWDKLEKYGWNKGNVPLKFKDLPDDEIWWPRNNQKDMQALAERAGWKVVTPDLNIVERDSIIVLQKP